MGQRPIPSITFLVSPNVFLGCLRRERPQKCCFLIAMQSSQNYETSFWSEADVVSGEACGALT